MSPCTPWSRRVSMRSSAEFPRSCPGSRSGSADVTAVYRQLHVDVALGGIGIRAHLMGGRDDPRRLLRVLNLRQGHIELDGDLETALLGGEQAHPAVDRDIAYLGAFTTADHAQGTLEAGRVAHREELFRVRATALAAHLLGRAELHIQGSVSRAPVAVGPAASDRCLRRVKNSRHLGSILGICRLPPHITVPTVRPPAEPYPCRAEVPAGASSAAASSRSSRCPSMSGSGTCLANHRGWYQSLDPAIAITAGTSVSRTTKASRNTPTAQLKPIALMVGSLVNMKATKMENMIIAAAVTTRADNAVPRWTARRASPFLVNSSLIRETTNTS